MCDDGGKIRWSEPMYLKQLSETYTDIMTEIKLTFENFKENKNNNYKQQTKSTTTTTTTVKQ